MDQLLKLVEQNGKKQIIENVAIPNQMNNAVIREISSHIVTELKQQAVQGNIQQIVSMFHSGGIKSVSANPIVANMMTRVTTGLNAKFGIAQQEAQSIASSLIPTVVNEVIEKSNDPRNIDFDLQQMMRTMTGNRDLNIKEVSDQLPQGALSNMGKIFGKFFGK